jgi:hypothetical protein
MLCILSILQIKKKWYEKLYLWIPILNLIWTLYTLDDKILSLEVDKSHFKIKSQMYQTQIQDLRTTNNLPRKIKVGDSIVYPDNEGWRDEIRGKIGSIIEINDEGVVAEIIDNDTHWTTSWDTIYRNNIVIIGNNVLKPFKFVDEN